MIKTNIKTKGGGIKTATKTRKGEKRTRKEV